MCFVSTVGYPPFFIFNSNEAAMSDERLQDLIGEDVRSSGSATLLG